MHLLNVLFGDGIVAAVGPVLICSMVDSIVSKCFLPGQRCVGLILSDLVVQQGLCIAGCHHCLFFSFVFRRIPG